MADSFSSARDPSPRRASPPGGPSPGDAQPEGDDSRHREEGKEGSRGTLGPNGSPDQEIQSAEQAASSAGYITNRPPEKTNTDNSGGEDWLEVSLYLRHRNFDSLSHMLDAARNAAENSAEGEDVVEFGGFKFLVRPSGAAAGGAGKRIYFRWQLHCENGLVIQLMNHEHPHRTMPNGNFRATSQILMRLGAKRVWESALELLTAIGCIVERNKISRVDPCADMPEMSIEMLCAAYTARCYVARARSSRMFQYEDQIVAVDSEVYTSGRAATGFIIGQGSVKLRVYDKFRESSNVPEKISTVVECRWGYWAVIASRIEFQLRREALKSMGIDTVEDWFEKRSAVCKYLCTEWFRLTSGPVDHNHADRSETLAEWKAVEEAFELWTGKAEYISLEPLESDEILPSALLQQVIGLLVSYFARTGIRFESNAALFELATRKLSTLAKSRNLLTEVRRRAMELGLMSRPFKEFEGE